MRCLAFLAAGVICLAVNGSAGAFPSGNVSRAESPQVQLVQDKQKPETMKKKVKRIWRNLTGYKFDVACPGFWMPINQSICTETGKNREDARAKCQDKHPFCQLRESSLWNSQSKQLAMSVKPDAVASR